MPQITLNGVKVEFQPGEVILKAANRAGVEVPQYCYHDGLSIVASCRICLAEIWMPDKATGKLAPFMGGKLMPTCQTAAAEGMVVYTDSPKAVANQKAVMEYLLINHPLDCPVCDQAGECLLQDYSYEYGRGASRFEETKIKQPKKDVGPNILLYSDRCIMCTRCVRFTREVTGTSELLVAGRGNREEIDVFPGQPLANELSANVADLCPVGALLDKDFLFAQRVWFLKEAPSIDGITASGDNLSVHHHDGKVYRLKPRTNMSVNKWWITDEVRYGWKFVNDERRLKTPMRKQFGVPVEAEWSRAILETVAGLRKAAEGGKKTAVIVSPMLSCEDAYMLGQAALAIDPGAFLAVGPVPVHGQDKTLPAGKPDGFRIYAEKCPNARGVRRVLEALSKTSKHHGYVATFEQISGQIASGEVGGVLLTGHYPSAWVTPAIERTFSAAAFLAVIDILPSPLTDRADVVLPGAAWLEKAGCFENARGMIQGFEQAVSAPGEAKIETQIGHLLMERAQGQASRTGPAGIHTASLPPAPTAAAGPADLRRQMAQRYPVLEALVTQISLPSVEATTRTDMAMVEV